MENLTVVYDANVLYSASLRDFLVELALSNIFQAHWTEEIHDEWIRNLLQNRPDVTLERLNRTKNLMNANVFGSLITGYEEIIPSLQLPDPNDRHVLAAAIHCGAKFIITFNLRDFPRSLLAPYNIQAQHPDIFILDLLAINAEPVCNAAQRQKNRLRNPPKTAEEYLETLANQGLSESVSLLRELCVEL